MTMSCGVHLSENVKIPETQAPHQPPRLEYREDKGLVARARKAQRFLSQPFFVAEIFTGTPGKYVSLEDTIKAFKGILNGDYDHLPEQAFYMVGTIEEAVEKAKTL